MFKFRMAALAAALVLPASFAADGARDRPAEDHHRRLARAGRQSVLHRHAARHPRPRPGARLGRGDGVRQRGQAQADQRRAGPGRARRQGHSDLADRRRGRECRLRRGGGGQDPDRVGGARLGLAQPDHPRGHGREADRPRHRGMDGAEARRQGQGRPADGTERRADVQESRRRLHRGDGEISRHPDRVPRRRSAHARARRQAGRGRAGRQSRPRRDLHRQRRRGARARCRP